MVTSLFKYDRIRTTDVKAKELRRWVDHVITLAKRGDLHARRQVMTIIRDKNLVHELFKNASEKYSNRSGGYTRIVKIGHRPGDAAPISFIELIDNSDSKQEKGSKPKKTQTPAPAPSIDSSVKTDVQTSVEEDKNTVDDQQTLSHENEETTVTTAETMPDTAPITTPDVSDTIKEKDVLDANNDDEKTEK
jgi:large subunit ribosomal protein L17